jgi:hypothetical protein
MANPVARLRFGSAVLLSASLSAAILGCGVQSPTPSPNPDSVAGPSASGAAAQAFLSLLDERQRADASVSFDNPERINWSYVPQERAGIPLRAMDVGQRTAALGLLGTGLSERAVGLARGIMELEGTLRELEEAVGSPWAARRDPELYYLTLFGHRGAAQPSGWRFEGHHLSVNATDLGPHGVIVAPVFMGASPARVPSGPQEGLRLLAAEEDLAFDLLDMLDAQQRARATIAAQTTGDIHTRNDPAVGPMALAGLPAAEMTAAQQHQLRQLLELYAGRMADDVAHLQLGRIEKAGFERLHFGWAGADRRGEPHYYRIHGPTVLVEYDNTQNDANHIHTVWRDLENDFGGDLLRRHYAGQAHHH